MVDHVLNHITNIRKESRVGMVQPDYRAMCKCGWEYKFASEDDASRACAHHKRYGTVTVVLSLKID